VVNHAMAHNGLPFLHRIVVSSARAGSAAWEPLTDVLITARVVDGFGTPTTYATTARSGFCWRATCDPRDWTGFRTSADVKARPSTDIALSEIANAMVYVAGSGDGHRLRRAVPADVQAVRREPPDRAGPGRLAEAVGRSRPGAARGANRREHGATDPRLSGPSPACRTFLGV